MITLDNSKEELQEYLEDAQTLYDKLRNYGKSEKELKSLKKRIEALKSMIKEFK